MVPALLHLLRHGTMSRVARAAACVAALMIMPGFAPGADALRRHCAGGPSCHSCHAFEPGRTHPVDIVPTLSVPADLPLENGRLTCLTCHDPNTDLPGQLRYSRMRGGDLCGACHDSRGADRMDAHAMAMRQAHLDPPGSGAVRASSGDGPDQESASCLACHDGSLARGDAFRLGSAPMSSARFIEGRHPIGVRQGPRWDGDNLLPAHRLDPAIRLFDERLGCGTCHSPYSRHDSLLIMSNQRSRLCLGCHDF